MKFFPMPATVFAAAVRDQQADEVVSGMETAGPGQAEHD
jgi:hypothetical protein